MIETIHYWTEHWIMVVGMFFFFSTIFTFYFPVYAQNRLPNLKLRELIAERPALRWLERGHIAWFIGTAIGMVLLALLSSKLQKLSRMGDEQGIFWLAALFSMPGLSMGILALRTGVYRRLRWTKNRSPFTDRFYVIAGTKFRWMPWFQTITAAMTGVLSVIGYFLKAPN